MKGVILKECADCGRPLRIKSFRLTGSGNYRSTCTKCQHIRDRYKITGKEFFQMLNNQMMSCLICERSIDELSAVIDHCHNNKKVRALLCHNCNVGIGHFKHDKEITARAVEYLENFS